MWGSTDALPCGSTEDSTPFTNATFTKSLYLTDATGNLAGLPGGDAGPNTRLLIGERKVDFVRRDHSVVRRGRGGTYPAGMELAKGSACAVVA